MFPDKFNFVQINVFVKISHIKKFQNNSLNLTEAIVNHKPRSFTQERPISGFFYTIYSLYVKNILLADKLFIFYITIYLHKM